MYFEYDSWNRIQIITYPDGEKVSYDYNRGGMLESVIGDKNGDTYKYIEEIRYNPFEQKESVHYGNGTVTDYSYDVLLRLSHLHSVCADGTMQDIDYDYDEVSNINSIENLAGVLPNNLGGTYRSDYTYDNLYRLTYADGNWHGNNTLYYETSIEYEKNGRISRKVLYADTWLDGNYATENYDNRYYYANSSQPNTLSYINDTPQQSFGWDQKGNMVFHHNGHSGYDRKLCWDEQNRLLGVKDEGKLLSYYLYDANGDRTYKFTGEYAAQNQSGQWHYYYLLNCPTLYASPYLVTNKKGYTKHYYAESERIASRIGGGGLQDLHKGFENYPDMVGKHKESSAKLFYKVMDCLDADALPQKDALKYLYEWQEVVEDEKDCYWYHPDHLGSSSWITYTDGSAVQHLHYLPWGEDFVDQRSTSWNAMYTFSAKEKDTETGYSYFGSRYYNSDLSIWLSVDPMAYKYPSLSPYVYCADNPVKLVDPNGEEFIGAVMGVLIGATTEIISQTIANGMNNLSEGENFFKGWGSKIDWVDVGVSAAVGALDGMAPGLGRTIAKVAGDVGGDILKASLDWKGENKPINGNGWGVVFYSKDPIRAACDLITNLANTGFKYASGINDISLINRSFSISGLLFESSLIGSFSGIFGTINYLK